MKVPIPNYEHSSLEAALMLENGRLERKVQKLRSTLETIKLRVGSNLHRNDAIYQLCDEILKETEL